MAWQQALLQGLSTATQQHQRASVAKEQAREQLRSIIEQNEHQKRINDRTNGQLEQMANAGAGPEAAQSTGQFVQQLRSARSRRDQATPTVHGASDAYASRQAGSRGQSNARENMLASAAGTQVGAGLQRQREGRDMARVNSSNRFDAMDAETDRYLSELRRRRIRMNPWALALAKVAGTMGENFPDSAASAPAVLADQPGTTGFNSNAAASSIWRELPAFGRVTG